MWFSFDGHEFETHESAEDAEKAAESAMDEWRDDAADGGWNDLSTQVCWGLVTHTVSVTQIPITDENRHTVPSGCEGLEEHQLEGVDRNVEADNERLRAAAMEREAQKNHTDQWYAVRWKRLHEFLSDVLGDENFILANSIMANGTAGGFEPPTYDRIVNALKAENKRLRERNKSLRSAGKELMRVVDEAYETTGFIRIAETSGQRIAIMSCLADHPDEESEKPE